MARQVHKIGDKVKFISKRDFKGTIVSEPFINEKGHERINILWDDTGLTTNWHPDLLIPLSVEYEDLPDIVEAGGAYYIKSIDGVVRLQPG